MTWKELCKYAENNGAKIYGGCFSFKGVIFNQLGEIFIEKDFYDKDGEPDIPYLTEDIEYDKMYDILKALQ